MGGVGKEDGVPASSVAAGTPEVAESEDPKTLEVEGRIFRAAANTLTQRGCGLKWSDTKIPNAMRTRACGKWFARFVRVLGFVFDPDGNRIEIIQWLEQYDPATSGADSFDP